MECETSPDLARGWKRILATVAVLHFIASVLLLVASLGAAVGVHEGEPAPGDAAVAALADLLAAPIVLARMLLPEAAAPGFGPLALLINSFGWGAAAVALVVGWRMWRDRHARGAEVPDSPR